MVDHSRHADSSKLLALAAREFLFAASWGLLAGAVFIPFLGSWYYMIPAGVLGAVYYLALKESAGEGPLMALELKQNTRSGKRKPTAQISYLRILLSVILFPPLLIGWAPLLFGGRSLPEIFTGICISSADRMLDPRPRRVIEEIRKAAEMRIRLLIIVPLLASGAMFFLKHTLPEAVSLTDTAVKASLPEHEQLLLTHYLEMTFQYPEEVEYHVRLASLYYRNNMNRDLQAELEVIQRLAPDHAILILADATPVTFEMLLSEDGNYLTDQTIATVYIPDQALQDSSSADTTETVLPDSLALPEETAAADTVSTLPSDSLEVPEALSDEGPEDDGDQPSEPVDATQDGQNHTEPEYEEDTLEPDQIL